MRTDLALAQELRMAEPVTPAAGPSPVLKGTVVFLLADLPADYHELQRFVFRFSYEGSLFRKKYVHTHTHTIKKHFFCFILVTL